MVEQQLSLRRLTRIVAGRFDAGTLSGPWLMLSRIQALDSTCWTLSSGCFIAAKGTENEYEETRSVVDDDAWRSILESRWSETLHAQYLVLLKHCKQMLSLKFQPTCSALQVRQSMPIQQYLWPGTTLSFTQPDQVHHPRTSGP